MAVASNRVIIKQDEDCFEISVADGIVVLMIVGVKSIGYGVIACSNNDHLASSSLLCRIASRMRLIYFLPLYSPCLRFTFMVTLRHPAYSLSLAYSCLPTSSFLRLSSARSRFSCSFLARNSSYSLRPCSLRFCFSSYSCY